jgi:hypothetical protein
MDQGFGSLAGEELKLSRVGISWLGNDGVPQSSFSCAGVCSRRRVPFGHVLSVLRSRSCSSFVLNSATMTQDGHCVCGVLLFGLIVRPL